MDPAAADGSPAPELKGTSLDGDPISITDDGRPKVIAFFSHWCPHCQAQVPVVVDWIDAGNLPDDVDLYAVSTSVIETRDNYPPSAWFDGEGWTIPTMVDSPDNAALLAVGAGSFPFWVVVGADGNVVTRTSGELKPEQITGLVEAARG